MIISHVAETVIKGVVIGFECLLNFLPGFVEMMNLLTIEIQPVCLQDKGAQSTCVL